MCNAPTESLFLDRRIELSIDSFLQESTNQSPKAVGLFFILVADIPVNAQAALSDAQPDAQLEAQLDAQ